MKRVPHYICWLASCAFALWCFAGCAPVPQDEVRVLKVGVIASLSGPARVWGETTVYCAQVVADFYNERGGFVVEGQRVKIELLVRDDRLDPDQTATIAHEFVELGIKYVIGPLGDSSLLAASRVLDGAGIFYVHYGFIQEVLRADSLCVLGMPKPEQSLPLLFRHLIEEEQVQSILVMPYGTEDGIQQKGIAESVAQEAGIDLLQLSRFDVSEQTFDLSLSAQALAQRVARVVAKAPDALLLAGYPPEAFVLIVDRLRSGGYHGLICAQNYQNEHSLAQLGDYSDGIFYVGGMPPNEIRTDYFQSLKERYMNLANEWSIEAETKLYALEFILACIKDAGLIALDDTSVMSSTLRDLRFKDPYYQQGRLLGISGTNDMGLPKQLQIPIQISKMSGGRAVLIEEHTSLADESDENIY